MLFVKKISKQNRKVKKYFFIEKFDLSLFIFNFNLINKKKYFLLNVF